MHINVHIAFYLLILEIVLHFYKKTVTCPVEQKRIINLMLVINVYMIYVLLSLYGKTKNILYLLPLLLYAFNYFYFGHRHDSKSGEMWILMGVITLGMLANIVFERK